MTTTIERPGGTHSANTPLKALIFYCAAPEAQSVHLMGDFNNWNPTSLPMERRSDGGWFLQVSLAQGEHQYQFLVDGVPTLDPNASGQARNAHYAEVSVIAVA